MLWINKESRCRGMMFASDLDRTLIYSKRALMDFPPQEELELVSVEKKLDTSVSFMTRQSLEYLELISAKLLFVPVTTRSLAQYERVSLYGTALRYAVTSNGATILYNGESLPDWTEEIKREMLETSLQLEEINDHIENHFHIQGELRVVENLFFYYYLSELVLPEVVEELHLFLSQKGWRLSLQGKKLYFIPNAMSKGKAIRFIQEREEVTTLIGAGDSVFDDDFLKLCQYPFILGHGELAQMYPLREGYKVIEQAGAAGGEELLKTILNLVEQSD